MKQLLLAAALTVAASAAHAQTAPPATLAKTAERTEEYCQLEARQRLNGRVVISVDFGQQRQVMSRNLLRDSAGNPVEFNSVVDALNWMNAQGWEFVNAYSAVSGSDGTSNYVLRRRVRL